MKPGRDLARIVGARARRKRRARRGRESVWFGLGMFGVVGWSVAVPTLIGIGVGAWLDARSSEPRISWTLTGLALGVLAGCAIAWHWVRQETARWSGEEPRRRRSEPTEGGPDDG